MPLKPAVRPVPSNPTGPLQGDPPPEIPRDQWDRPLVVPYSQWRGPDVWHTPVGMTRASTLGGTSEDQWGLNEWRTGLAVTAATQSEALILRGRLLGLGPADKKARAQLGRDALVRAESDSAASIGTSFHSLVDMSDRQESVPDVGEYNAALDAYRELVQYFRFHAIELFVVNEELKAAGTADRVGELREGWELVAPDGSILRAGVRTIDDLKTSSTANWFGIKFCVQFAVYAGGRPYRHLESRSIGRGKQIEVRGEYLDWPDGVAPSRDWGLIIHAPAGQQDIALEDMLHWVPLEAGRELARRANQTREDRKTTWIVPAGLPVATKQVRFKAPGAMTHDELVAAIKNTTSELSLTTLWDEYGELNAWTDECDAAADKAMERIEAIEKARVSERENNRGVDLLAKDDEMASWTTSEQRLGPPRPGECGARIANDTPPVEVRILQLKSKIYEVKSEDELDALYGANIELWEAHRDDFDRMAGAVLRNLGGVS